MQTGHEICADSRSDVTRSLLYVCRPKDPLLSIVIEEIPLPAGPGSLLYGMATDDKDRIWVAQNVPNQGTTLVGYDPRTKRFFGEAKVGRAANNTIRHMYFDRRRGMLWFGTDQGAIGRAEVSRARVAM